MKVIFKYPLKEVAIQSLKMPKDAEILSIQHKDDCLCVWALVNDESAIEERCFEIFGTGQQINTGVGTKREHISTVQQGLFVWHIFELKKL